MREEPIIERHYAKVDGLVPRTTIEPGPPSVARLEGVRIHDPHLESPHLVSSVHGELREIMFTIPHYAVKPPGKGKPNPLAQIYADLFDKLPSSCRYVVTTHKSASQAVKELIESVDPDIDAEVIAVPDDLRFSVWAEDACVVVRDDKTSDRYLLEPYEFLRYGDNVVATLVSDSTPLRSRRVPLYLQGGNVLVGDDFFFVGADYPLKTLDYVKSVISPLPGDTPEQTVRQAYERYMDPQRRLIYVGSRVPVPPETHNSVVIKGEPWTEIIHFGNDKGTVQPLFHIDMFLTLAGRDDANGKYRVLVGDPAQAARALNQEPWPHAMQEVFDDIAEQLQQDGFEVIRSPLPLAYFDDPGTKHRTWYFATANNALVQIDGRGGKQVWLPTYGYGQWAKLAVTDKANRDIWERDLGFDVSLLSDFHPFAENLGAVHCIKKYLDRA